MVSRGCREGETERCSMRRVSFEDESVPEVWYTLCDYLCNPINCSPPNSSVHGDAPGKNTGVDCHVLLQGLFLTQGSNPGLPQCRQILHCLSHQGSPM